MPDKQRSTPFGSIAGFDGYLAKPFKIGRLGELLDRFVQSGTV